MPRRGTSIHSILILKMTTGMAAAIICPKSFTFGGREYTSSAMPTAIKNVAPTMMPTIS